jgi:tripeptide aminopeptidase
MARRFFFQSRPPPPGSPACPAPRFASLTIALALRLRRRRGPRPGASAHGANPPQVRPEVDKAYTQLMAAPAVQKLLEAVKADHERSVEELRSC